jgi:hypothetical protein
MVPKSAITHTESALREAGNDGYERFALWSGHLENDKFIVTTSHVPA